MKKRVLLVDDKEEFRKLVQLFLSEHYEVETAADGMSALAMLQQGYLPDAIVSDMMMPDVGGAELLKQLKASGAFNKIPVIILSSIDKSAKRIEMLQAGAEDYMIKPFNPMELQVRLAKTLAN